jgi:hypothetical protein
MKVKDKEARARLKYFIYYVCLVRRTIESTFDRPYATTYCSERIGDDVFHLIGIDSCVVPVLREEESECSILLLESSSLQVDDESSLGRLECFEETYIRKGGVRLLDRRLLSS